MHFTSSAIRFLCLSTVILTFNLLKSQPKLKNNQLRILITGANIHTGKGDVLKNGAIGFKEGKINLLLSAEELQRVKINRTEFDTIINLNGKEIYPAFIAPNSTLGLNEVDAVRATQDFAETGIYNPHVRSIIAYNTDSKVTPTVRTNGVLYAQITPRDGIISGKSSVVQFDAWNWEDAAVKIDDGIHLNFPSMLQRSGWWAEPEASSTNAKYDEQINELKQFFDDASYYSKTTDHPEKNLRLDAMRCIFNGSANLYVHADYVKDISAAIQFLKSYNIAKIVLVGGKDSWKITSLLKQYGISVMLNRVHDLPNSEHDDIDLPFKLPYLLQKDSVLFCLQNQGDMEGMNTRNLPFLAGTACAYGLTKEQAIAAISYNAAKILGIDDKIGSLEIGKQASLIISGGDVLDMKTSIIELAFIDGRIIDLDNHQKQLFKKYSNKYNLNEK
jgi:imidazolonepropionase-like amidohydrolase